MSLIVTLNIGSSSVKFAAFDADCDEHALARGEVDGFGEAARFGMSVAGKPAALPQAKSAPANHSSAVHLVFDALRETMAGQTIAAVGHRIVHGGPTYTSATLIDDQALKVLTALAPLAPLHQPHNLAGVRAAREAFAGVPQVACFDTAFHRTHPFVADVFALPKHFYDEGVRRYGFHGLSYEYVTTVLQNLDADLASKRVVIAHLGNGASMCAVREGRSVASTMGFSALEGLPMGTRCGEIDPGVVLYLLQQKGMTADAVSDLLYTRSGLLGLSGLSHDMRLLEASSSEDARHAIDYFVYRCRRELGAMAAILGGLDVLAFTGGIGEHAVSIRARICEGMDWCGLALDARANADGMQRVSPAGSRVCTYVIPTDEERTIARHTRDLLARTS